MSELNKDRLELLYKIAKHHCASGLFSGIETPEQAFSIMILGEELGVSPTKALTDVHILRGKLIMGAGLMGALLKKSGKYTYKSTVDDKCAELEFFENKGNGEYMSLGISRFSMDDAQKAGLLGNATWKKYPRNMLFARALSNGARWFCGDAFGGTAYVEGEVPTEDEETSASTQKQKTDNRKVEEGWSIRAAMTYIMKSGLVSSEAEAQAMAKEVDSMSELTATEKKKHLRDMLSKLQVEVEGE